MGRKALCICFLILLSGMSAAVLASEGFNAGPLRVKPALEGYVTFDDNALLAPEDEAQDDVVYTIKPIIVLELPFSGHYFQLEYSPEFRRYSDFDSEDADLQNVELQGVLNISSQFEVRILESYRELAGDTDEIVGRVEYSRNEAMVKGTYDLNSKMSIEAFYRNLMYDYDAADLIGRTENQVGAAVVYNLYDKWGGLAEVSHGEVDIDDTELDASYNRILAGVRGEFTPKLVGEVKAGWEMRSYEGDREDKDVGYLIGVVTHQVAPDMKLEIGAIRETVESITYTGSAYTATQGRASLTKEFADRISIILSGYFQTNEYEDPVLHGDVLEDREDDIWQAEVKVEYRLNRYAYLLAGLEHKNNDSTFDEDDYEYNRIKFGARVEY